MIQITAYLRDEADLKLWKALPNKAEWLHDNLKRPHEEKPKPMEAEIKGDDITLKDKT